MRKVQLEIDVIKEICPEVVNLPNLPRKKKKELKKKITLLIKEILTDVINKGL